LITDASFVNISGQTCKSHASQQPNYQKKSPKTVFFNHSTRKNHIVQLGNKVKYKQNDSNHETQTHSYNTIYELL